MIHLVLGAAFNLCLAMLMVVSAHFFFLVRMVSDSAWAWLLLLAPLLTGLLPILINWLVTLRFGALKKDSPLFHSSLHWLHNCADIIGNPARTMKDIRSFLLRVLFLGNNLSGPQQGEWVDRPRVRTFPVVRTRSATGC